MSLRILQDQYKLMIISTEEHSALDTQVAQHTLETQLADPGTL